MCAQHIDSQTFLFRTASGDRCKMNQNVNLSAAVELLEFLRSREIAADGVYSQVFGRLAGKTNRLVGAGRRECSGQRTSDEAARARDEDSAHV